MTLVATALDQFDAHLAADGHAEKTRTAYRRSLRQVFTVLGRQQPALLLETITATTLGQALTDPAILTHADGTPKAPATLNRLRAAVRLFFTWATMAELLPTNPAAGVRLQRVPRTPPTFLTDSDVRKLLKCLTGRVGELARRDRVLLEVFLGTGIRLQELVMLDVEDVDLEAKHLHVRRAKGGVPQIKFLNSHLRTLLRGYLTWRRRQGTDQCAAFLLSQRGTRLSPRQVAYRLAYWLQEAGIDKPLTPHGLRHTFATRLYSRTGDLLVVQRALGHRQIATTEIYTHLVDGALEEALERL
ncbi:MAG: tyrosine-type recombinase/integrase [Armatimonadota bacterium]